MLFTTVKKLFIAPFLVTLMMGCQREVTNLLNTDSNLAPPIVNAGNSQTIQLPATTFTLNGSATTTNGNIRAYLWSMVTGPNVPVINSPGSRITTVSGFTSGTYIFQLMATDSAGLVGVDTTQVQVNASPIQTLILQPSNSTEALLALLGGSPATDPAPPELCAGAWTNGGSEFLLRGALKFNLSSIPTSATILSAKLTLYSNPTPLNGDHINANSGSNNSMYIRRYLSNWIPGTINWNNQPSTSSTDQVLIPHTTASFLDLNDIDVKTLVSMMVGTGNYGFSISLQNETIYTMRNFCSSRYSDASKYPKLVITYQP